MTSPRRTKLGARTEELLGDRSGDRALRMSDLLEVLPVAVLRVIEAAGYRSGDRFMPPDGTYGDISVAGSTWTVEPDVISLDDLADVINSTPAEGQTLRFNGTEFVNSFIGLRLPLAIRTASASASLDFTEFNNAVYRRYEFELENVRPAADDVAMLFRTSTDGGSSYDSTGGDYQWSVTGMNGATAASSGSVSAGSIVLTGNTAGARPGNAAGEYGVSGVVNLYNAGNPASATDLQGRINFMNPSTAYSHYTVGGARVAAADVDACRFLYNGANTASGIIRMFGIV